MSTQHEIVIDASRLDTVNPKDRAWLENWLRQPTARWRGSRVTIGCASAAETERVAVMLTRRGLPRNAIVSGAR